LLSEWYLAGYYRGRKEGMEEAKKGKKD